MPIPVVNKLKRPKPIKDLTLPEIKDDAGWVDYVTKNHDHALAKRRRYEFQWCLNLAHYMGYQHLIFNPRTGLLEIPKMEDSPPLTINRIGSFTDSRHAKLTKNRPIPRVLPATNDLPDQRAAKFSDQALQYLWHKIDMEDEEDRRTMLMLICGTAFVETLWDPFAGEVVRETKTEANAEDPLTQDILLNEDGTVQEDETFMGEVSCRALSAFKVLVANDQCPTVKDQEWIITRKHLSFVEAEKLYPHLKGELIREGIESSHTQYEQLTARLAASAFSSIGVEGGFSRDTLNSECLLKVMWIKPNLLYPKGLVVGVTGKNLAFMNEWPNGYGRNAYPIVRFVERENGFHFWGQSSIERLIPVQKVFNQLRRQTAKNAQLMANIKWMVAKGSQIEDEALNDEEGEIVMYNPAVPEPKPAQVQGMPAYVDRLGQELIIDFRDVGGQRESSVTPPSNLTAGVSIQIASEMADEIIGPILRRAARSLSLVGEQQLLLINDEWDEPRKIKVIGDEGAVAVLWISKADLRNHTDVKIEVESMYPDFRGAKRQTLLDLWDRRIVDDPKKILKAFRYGNYDLLLDDEEKLDEQIYLDIQRIKKGKAPLVSPLQNHLAYVKEMTKWINAPEFLRLIPERKALAIEVLQAHIQMIMGQLPGNGEPVMGQNQNAVGTPFGPSVPAGSSGNSRLTAIK